MKLYLCKWPDGSGKVVTCKNKQELFWALDFEGDPYAAHYKEFKEDFAVNFNVVTKQEGTEEYQETVFAEYDCEYDYLPDLLADKKGWHNFHDYFPYDVEVKTSAARAACEFMGWGPKWLVA
ncbi:hypothetical protein OAL72_00970 [bacterium]|nr:hypothetical protein [bacterium]